MMRTSCVSLRGYLVLAMVGMAILTGCNTAYVPNTINVPMLRNKGQFKIYADPKINVQLAGAITDNVGIMANAHYIPSRTHLVGDTVASEGNGGQFDIGVGYFGTIEPNMTLTADFVGEVYAGAGYGSLFINDKQTGKDYSINAAKLFIQPSIGFSHKYIDVAIGTRIVGLMYSTPSSGYTDAELQSKNMPDRSRPTHAFVEPMITLRGGLEFLKLQVQVGSSWQVTAPKIVYDETIITMGVMLDIGRVTSGTP